MLKSFPGILTLAATAALATACGFERSQTILTPTDVAGSAPSANKGNPSPGASTSSLVGTWASAQAPLLPSPSSCGDFQWQVTSQTANSVSGTFSVRCGGGLIVSGTASGTINGNQMPMTASGTASLPGIPTCSLSLSGTGTIVDSNTLTISYSGTTCLGPLSGTETLRKRT